MKAKVLMEFPGGIHILKAALEAIAGGYSHMIFNDQLYAVAVTATSINVPEKLKLLEAKALGVTSATLNINE